ncbi:MAG: hypothetical protein WC423_08265 [Vulcanimicrobiota bacterium]
MPEFELWRQDDNGNRFLISTFTKLDDAERELGTVKSKGHKQHYWLAAKEEAESGTTDAERIRLRPALYVGSLDSRGGEHLLYEIIANSVDQFLQGLSTEIVVELNGQSFKVLDNGAGLERREAARFLTRFHDSATADQHAPHIHMSPTGVGLCAVNALASGFSMESFDKSGRWRLDCSRGELQDSKSPTISDGTQVLVDLDPRVFGNHGPNPHRVRRVLFDAVHLFPNLKIQFNEESFYAPEGLLALAEFEALQRELSAPSGDTWKRFGHQADSDELGLSFACYGDSREGEPSIISWVNGRLTPAHGTHVDGAIDVLSKQEWKPSTVLIHVWMKEPEYAGPTMDKLRAPKVRDIVSRQLSAPIGDFLAGALS